MKNWSNAIKLPVTCSWSDNAVKQCRRKLESALVLAQYAVAVALFHQSDFH